MSVNAYATGALCLAALMLGGLLTACGHGGRSPEEMAAIRERLLTDQSAFELRDDSTGDTWMRRGDRCVRESEEGPVRRVINRTDPELCGRSRKHRPQVYVRVVPPPGMRSR